MGERLARLRGVAVSGIRVVSQRLPSVPRMPTFAVRGVWQGCPHPLPPLFPTPIAMGLPIAMGEGSHVPASGALFGRADTRGRTGGVWAGNGTTGFPARAMPAKRFRRARRYGSSVPERERGSLAIV